MTAETPLFSGLLYFSILRDSDWETPIQASNRRFSLTPISAVKSQESVESEVLALGVAGNRIAKFLTFFFRAVIYSFERRNPDFRGQS